MKSCQYYWSEYLYEENYTENGCNHPDHPWCCSYCPADCPDKLAHTHVLVDTETDIAMFECSTLNDMFDYISEAMEHGIYLTIIPAAEWAAAHPVKDHSFLLDDNDGLPF